MRHSICIACSIIPLHADLDVLQCPCYCGKMARNCHYKLNRKPTLRDHVCRMSFVLPMPTHRQALTELKVSAKIVDQSEFLDGRKGLILSAEHMHAEQRVYRDMVCTGSMRHLQ